VYLCICEVNRTRGVCFNHNPSLDHCDLCLSGGKCVRGDLQEPNDFLCLCPHCYSGRRCEFSMQPFTLILDSLLVYERLHVQSVYIGTVFVLFVIGLFNNLCSLVTFKRSRPREVAVGYCLLIITILNQCGLFFLLLKFIHILMGAAAGWTSDVSCKIISYLLVVFTRTIYWLTSWISVDRLLIIIFPTAQATKDPRVAVGSSIAIFFSLLAMHIHEILFSISLRQPESIVSLCVIDFGNQSTIADYHRVSALLHYLIPFLIQVISITILIVLAARQRAKTAKKSITFGQVLRKQFMTQKELYVIPGIIVLSALPQGILSFSLTCRQLSDWQRHILLAAYLLSYAPQVLGFLLYVIPSSVYLKEFKDTSLAKKSLGWLFKPTANKNV